MQVLKDSLFAATLTQERIWGPRNPAHMHCQDHPGGAGSSREAGTVGLPHPFSMPSKPIGCLSRMIHSSTRGVFALHIKSKKVGREHSVNYSKATTSRQHGKGSWRGLKNKSTQRSRPVSVRCDSASQTPTFTAGPGVRIAD